MRIAFDLDGTLIDSLPHIHAALSAGLTDRGLPTIPLETMRDFVGKGLANLIARVLDHLGRPPEDHAALSERVLYHYLAIPSDPACVYPGARDALQTLKDSGHHLAICTNKPFQAALVALHQTQLLDLFDLVIGGDSLPNTKPHPQMLQACVADAFVGDSEVDAETADAGGVPFLLFTKGYRKGPITAMTHRATFDRHAQLPTLV